MNKRLIMNLSATIASFAVNLLINFVITRYIIGDLGEKSYGFIGLANNFVSYASIMTIALNSVAGRFITVKIHQNKIEDANRYFNSVLISNSFMSVVLAIISLVTILNLSSIINIPYDLRVDVKITFAVVFANFILNILLSVYSIATFVRNRLDLSAIQTIISNILKIIVLFILFTLFKTKIYFISIAAIFATTYLGITNWRYTKILLPEIRMNLSNFSFKAIKELISQGLWNSMNSLSNILISGVDLLIANIFVSASDMGLLSVAKTVPILISSLLSTIANVFAPKFTILYAKGNIKQLVKEINMSIKILGLVSAVPLAGFIIFGTDFYTLWLPTLNHDSIMKIQILSILSIGPTFISAFVFSLYSISVITNKLKVPVLLTLGISLISIFIVIILLKTTNFGVYAIAGVSSIFLIFRVVFFVPTYAAYILKIKLNSFYKPMITGVSSFALICIVFYLIKQKINITSWLQLLNVAIIAGIIGYIINFLIIMNKSEKILIKDKLKNMLKIKFSKK